MSEIKTPHFKVKGRRYSHLKQTLLHDGQADFTGSNPVESSLPGGEDFYRQMFERNRAVKLVVDPSTAQIIQANQSACDFYGYTAKQFKSLRVTDLTVLPEAKLVADLQRTVVEKGTTFQARHRLASGEIRDVEIFSGSLEFNHKPYLYAIIQDITARIKAEKALRESETLYRLLARNIPNSAVFMFDRDMRYTLAEGPFLRRYGDLYSNVIGKTLQEALPEAAANFLVPIHQRALQGESFSYERVLGDYAYQAFATPVRDEEGHIVGGMILSHDITDIKKTEKALYESEALHRLFTQNMPNTSVIIFDKDMCFTLAEGGFLKRAGLISDNLIGKKPHEVFSEETLNFMLPLYQRTLRGESFTYDRVMPDYAYQSYANPLKNSDGEIIGGMFLTYDVTEAKQAEAALRVSEYRFHSLVDLAPVGIIQTDIEGKRVFCNSHWCEMTGITLEQALSDERYETIYPDDLPIATAAWETMMETKLPFVNAVFRYQRPDKTTLWVSGNGRPLLDENGIVIGYLGTVTDISEHKMLEDTLLLSESRYRTLINFAPVGIVETDTNGNIMLANTQWSALSGVSEVDAFSGYASSTIHPDDIALTQALQQESVEHGGTVDNIEYRFLHPDGRVVWVSDSSRPLFDELGTINGHIITMTDITERKRLEEALRQNEERLKIVTDNIHDLVTQIDTEDRVVFASPSSRIILGIKPEDIIGNFTYDFVHPEDKGKMIAARKVALENGEVHISGEGRLRHADGHYIDVEMEGTILFDEQSNYVGSVLITRDITERKRLGEELRQNEERLRNITDNLQDMVSQSDAEGLFTFVSPSYHTILGYEVKSLIGKSAMEMIHPEDLGRIVQAFQDAFETDTYHFNVECRLRHVDGHYIDVDIAGKLFFDNKAKFIGGVFISRDISERKRMQNLLLEKEKLQGVLDKEHELSALKTRMMERIAHEFRTPLTVIQAATETLTYYFDRLTPDQRNAKGITIKGQIQRLTDMLQEIGLVVNGNFKPDRVHRQATDVSALCHELATELERQLNFPGKYVLNLPESTIASLDPHVTKNAIRHIMRNAARFSTPSSVVNVNLSHTEDGICLRVIDTGIGIPAKEQPRLFEPFFRGSNINEVSGLGVGLTIARAAIEAQDGTIKIESVVGQGTTVTIWFPN